MCGIFGYIPSKEQNQHQLHEVGKSLCKALKQRGPNDYGYNLFANDKTLLASETASYASTETPASLILGQTRLSIIDLSEAGHQPFFSEDKRYTLVYNGEIYNYLELRAELEKLGVHFKTATDTEVLLKSLMHWGTACLTKLTGMFAFALYDKQEQTIMLARDFFGIKPLYWTRQKDTSFAFASELPALLKFPNIRRQLNWTQAYNYLVNYRVGVGDECFIDNIFQVKPAHYMLFNANNGTCLQDERYWQVSLPSPQKISFQEAAEEARRLFLNSVRLHLRSDVPLGVALSGGIDSSATACAVRHIEPDMPLHTFTYVAADSVDISEEKWADKVIKHTNAISHKVKVASHELCHDLDNMIERLGEPFVSTSIYAQYRVFKLVREKGVVVTLDGQGADEMLAGYFGYPHYRLQTLVQKGQLREAWNFYQNCKQWEGRSPKEVLSRFIGLYTPNWLKPCARKIINKPISPDWLNIKNIYARKVDQYPSSALDIYSSKDKVREILANQLTWNGLPNLLRHGDRNSMTFSIESRVPFCTKELAEFFLSLPEEYLISKDGWTKAVFRQAMRGIVPDDLLDRKDKIGFATPEKKWFVEMDDWVVESLAQSKYSELFDSKFLLHSWQNIYNEKTQFSWHIWRCINYLRWKELFNIQE